MTSRRRQDPLAFQSEVFDLPRLRSHALIKFLEGFEHGRRWALLQDLPWRRPKQEHVFHASSSAEHHVQVQPPGLLSFLQYASALALRAVDGHPGADRLAL
eukprot:1093146-Pyramimonas_sp.AAC.1